MTFAAGRPYADPEAAARKLVEIANSVEAVQDTAGSSSNALPDHLITGLTRTSGDGAKRA
jgi:hypothetical protein